VLLAVMTPVDPAVGGDDPTSKTESTTEICKQRVPPSNKRKVQYMQGVSEKSQVSVLRTELRFTPKYAFNKKVTTGAMKPS
jgi:hypothetical protein